MGIRINEMKNKAMMLMTGNNSKLFQDDAFGQRKYGKTQVLH